MKSKIRRIIFRYKTLRIVLFFSGSLMLLYLPHYLNAEPPKIKKGPPPALVEVSTVVEKEIASRITLVGTAEPWLETVVAAEENGLVWNMPVDEGDHVKKDQLLCEQNTTQLGLRIQAAMAAVAEADVLQARAQREWERQKKLFSIDSVSEKSYEDSQFEAEASAKKVARLRAELHVLKDQLIKMKIKAPVSGFVLERHALPGQWLGEGDPVVTLSMLNTIRVMVPVPERYVPALNTGDPCRVIFDAFADRTFEGIIAAVIPRADEATRTFPIRIEISNPDGLIKGGMLGRATLPIGKPYKTILVPKDALVLSEAGKSVYVVNSQSAHIVPVKTGYALGPLIEVKGDLKAGQKIVIRGNERLRPGQAVRIIPGKGIEK
ncbi:MAG: efflux RND transporter periplasmic adaptor subunit [Desulfobacterales bacterium]|nr:efflux RND transporter periplasmic adaptor subunit [Desulfobacterales bacterium]